MNGIASAAAGTLLGLATLGSCEGGGETVSPSRPELSAAPQLRIGSRGTARFADLDADGQLDIVWASDEGTVCSFGRAKLGSPPSFGPEEQCLAPAYALLVDSRDRQTLVGIFEELWVADHATADKITDFRGVSAFVDWKSTGNREDLLLHRYDETYVLTREGTAFGHPRRVLDLPSWVARVVPIRFDSMADDEFLLAGSFHGWGKSVRAEIWRRSGSDGVSMVRSFDVPFYSPVQAEPLFSQRRMTGVAILDRATHELVVVAGERVGRETWFGVAQHPSRMLPVDFDADGVTDLVVFGSRFWTVLHGDSTRGFDWACDREGYSGDLVVQDVDGDGRLDLIAATYGPEGRDIEVRLDIQRAWTPEAADCGPTTGTDHPWWMPGRQQ